MTSNRRQINRPKEAKEDKTQRGRLKTDDQSLKFLAENYTPPGVVIVKVYNPDGSVTVGTIDRQAINIDGVRDLQLMQNIPRLVKDPEVVLQKESYKRRLLYAAFEASENGASYKPTTQAPAEIRNARATIVQIKKNLEIMKRNNFQSERNEIAKSILEEQMERAIKVLDEVIVWHSTSGGVKPVSMRDRLLAAHVSSNIFGKVTTAWPDESTRDYSRLFDAPKANKDFSLRIVEMLDSKLVGQFPFLSSEKAALVRMFTDEKFLQALTGVDVKDTTPESARVLNTPIYIGGWMTAMERFAEGHAPPNEVAPTDRISSLNVVSTTLLRLMCGVRFAPQSEEGFWVDIYGLEAGDFKWDQSPSTLRKQMKDKGVFIKGQLGNALEAKGNFDYLFDELHMSVKMEEAAEAALKKVPPKMEAAGGVEQVVTTTFDFELKAKISPKDLRFFEDSKFAKFREWLKGNENLPSEKKTRKYATRIGPSQRVRQFIAGVKNSAVWAEKESELTSFLLAFSDRRCQDMAVERLSGAFFMIGEAEVFGTVEAYVGVANDDAEEAGDFNFE